METTSSIAIATTGASLTSGPVYTDAREALTEAPIRAAAPLKSPKCILFHTETKRVLMKTVLQGVCSTDQCCSEGMIEKCNYEQDFRF